VNCQVGQGGFSYKLTSYQVTDTWGNINNVQWWKGLARTNLLKIKVWVVREI
jgi:hypothetical protein